MEKSSNLQKLSALLPMGAETDSLKYQSCYCEENVWHLCRRAVDHGIGDNVYAVFISSPDKIVPMWRQKSSPTSLLFWDYHVITMEVLSSGEVVVWDHDTTLPFPVPLADYLELSFMPKFTRECLDPDVHIVDSVRFRVVRADELCTSFSSDRSHMKKDNGTWSAEPPQWPIIQVEGQPATNLMTYIDMESRPKGASGFGQVMDMDTLASFHRQG